MSLRKAAEHALNVLGDLPISKPVIDAALGLKYALAEEKDFKRLTNKEIQAVARECTITLNKHTVEFDFAKALMDKLEIKNEK